MYVGVASQVRIAKGPQSSVCHLRFNSVLLQTASSKRHTRHPLTIPKPPILLLMSSVLTLSCLVTSTNLQYSISTGLDPSVLDCNPLNIFLVPQDYDILP